jgi:hypothetical protein
MGINMPKSFGNIVVHAGSGLLMPEKTAREIEEISKSVPPDFKYRRVAKSAHDFSVDEGSRCDVSYITTDDVDREGEVVLPNGIDRAKYNGVVTLAHDYRALPVGSNWWIRPQEKDARHGLLARTHYPPKPADWGDAPWMPSAILHLMQQPVPTCTGKSIGFIPLNIRGATIEEKSKRPELKDAPIVDRSVLLEYAVAPVPCNASAEMVSVSKALRESVEKGIFNKDTADIFAEVFGIVDQKADSLATLDAASEKLAEVAANIRISNVAEKESMPACPKCLSPDKVTRKTDGDMYTCGVCNLDFSPATEAKIAAALAAPFVAAETYLEQERRRAKERQQWAAAETIRQINLALAAAAGRV